MKKILIHFLQYTIFLGLSILLLWLAFRSIDFNELWIKLENARYDFIALSLGIGFLGIYFRALRWKLMIEPLGYSPSKSHAFYALCIGYMANYAFPRIGEVTRCGVLSKSDKIPADALLGTVIAERVFDVIILFLLTIIVILLKIQLFGNFFYDKVYQPVVEKFSSLFDFSFAVFLIIGGSIVAIILLIYAFRENIMKITFVRKVGKLGKGVFSGVISVFRIKKFGGFLAYTVLMWGTYWIMTYTFLLALGATENLDLADALFVMVAGSYGMAAPVQAGIGAYHGIVALSLSIYAISWADGLAFALLSHGAQAIGIILIGIIALFILFYKNRYLNKKNKSSLSEIKS